MEARTRFESLPLGLLLALAGGSLDCYTYLNRGEVFATAETGNLVLLGVQLAQGRMNLALHYLPPILAYAAGVLAVEWFSRAVGGRIGDIRWRQIILLLECAVVMVVGVLPVGRLDSIANILISFTSAMQVEGFRSFDGCPCATTMCTGNLRSGTENLYHFLDGQNRAAGKKTMVYYGLILAFVSGAVISAVISPLLGGRTIFLSCLFLIAALYKLTKKDP